MKQKKLIEYLNYKDILIILGTWYLTAIIILILKEIQFQYALITDIFHFLFIISGRFIYLALISLYLSSLYPLDYEVLGLNFKQFKNQFKDSMSKIILLFLLVIVFINIPASFLTEFEFSPLFKITGPESLVSSLFPFLLIFSACLFISLSEQFILNIVLFELLKFTHLNNFFSLLLSSLLYSIILIELQPGRILLNTLTALISILLYKKRNSIIPASLFTAAYYSLYIVYIYGFDFIRF